MTILWESGYMAILRVGGNGYIDENGGHGYTDERGDMTIFWEWGDMSIMREIGGHCYTEGMVGHGYIQGKEGHGYTGGKGGHAYIEVNSEMAILTVSKCEVTLLMTVGTVCIAACTAVPRMMAITKLQVALCCLPAYCILSCTIWLTVLKFITWQL